MSDDNNLLKILETMARVDERTQAMAKQFAEHRENTKETHETLKQSVDSLKKAVKDEYVTKETFNPVQRIVYGIVSIILTAVVMAIIGLVVLK